MHRGILNTVVVVLAGTVAPGVSAQTRTPQATATARQAPISAAQAMMAAVPTMPNVVGLTADSATRLLANLRVLAKAPAIPIVRRDSSTNAAPRDRVIGQQPQAKTPLSSFRYITIIVAIPVSNASSPDDVVAPVVGGTIIPPKPDVTRPPPGPASTTRVPLLVGRDARHADTTLAMVGLRLDRRIVVDYSDIVESGFVYQQHPLPRTRVDTGSTVKIWISRGPHRTTVTIPTPNVLDRTLYDADLILRKSRLVIGHVDTIFKSGAGGLIVHQLPEPGDSAHPGDAVALQVAIAPPLTTVPSVIGLRRAQADATLRQAGLALGQVTPVTGQGSDTSIVRQTPPAQTAVARGTFVDVDESQPIIRRRAIVPSLAGLTETLADKRLAKDGLVLGRVVVSDTGAAPLVVAQNPAANDSAFVNDRVSITLASPPGVLPKPPATPTKKPGTATRPPDTTTTIRLIAVPQVTNISFELARSLINNAGLTTVSTTTDTGRTFIVRSQRPAAGSYVPARAPVALVLERLEIRSVPYLVTLKRADAETHAKAEGYTMSVAITQKALLQLFDRVSWQEPDSVIVNRGNQVIQVELTTPLVPPITAAAVALVLVAAGTAAKVRDPRGRRVDRKPLTDLSIVLDTRSAVAPVSISAPNDRVIRAAITYTLDSGHGKWILVSHDDSLIAHEKPNV